MQNSAVNISRPLVTVVLAVVIGILIYIMTTHTRYASQDASVGVGSPVTADKMAPTQNDLVNDFDKFNDGLTHPSAETEIEPDEFGVGTTNVRVYRRDLNGDGITDRITRTHIENGTSHFTNEYKVELATGNGWFDITPQNFRTVESADCAIQKLRFFFEPTFTVEIIGRSIADDYITPTMAYRTVYQMTGNKLTQIGHTPIKEVCDVSGLFIQ